MRCSIVESENPCLSIVLCEMEDSIAIKIERTTRALESPPIFWTDRFVWGRVQWRNRERNRAMP